MKYVLNRLKEKTTWLGLISLLTLAGVNVSPELSQAIINLGITLAAVIMIITKEKSGDTSDQH